MAGISTLKVSELEEKIKQLQAQRQQLLTRVKEEEGRKRTRRLIEIGATMDSIGIDTLEKDNAFKKGFKINPEVQKWINSLFGQFKNSKENTTSK